MMKTQFPFARFGAFLFLSAALTPLPRALAQPDIAPPATTPTKDSVAPVDPVSLVTTRNGFSMLLNLKDADLTTTLSDIATLGNLEILTRGEIVGDATLKTQGSPEEVLRALCKSNFLSCRKVDGVWIVEESKTLAPNPSPETMSDLSFRDMEAREIIQMVGETFHLKVEVAPEIKTKIAFIRLSSRSPREALQQVALAADLEMTEHDGQILLAPTKPVAK